MFFESNASNHHPLNIVTQPIHAIPSDVLS